MYHVSRKYVQYRAPRERIIDCVLPYDDVSTVSTNVRACRAQMPMIVHVWLCVCFISSSLKGVAQTGSLGMLCKLPWVILRPDSCSSQNFS
jgi:hypothetical protein